MGLGGVVECILSRRFVGGGPWSCIMVHRKRRAAVEDQIYRRWIKRTAVALEVMAYDKENVLGHHGDDGHHGGGLG